MLYHHRLIAHRGWQRHFPENTLAAIEAAIHAGARHVEIDIQLTADHVPVLCHDQSLLRLCAVNQRIDLLTRDQLTELSAFEPARLGDKFKGTPLSTLAACVALIEDHPDVTLYVEIKCESLQTFGADLVLNAVLPELTAIHQHCFLISFDVPVLAAARRAGWFKIAPVLTTLNQLESETFRQLAPDMVFCDSNLLTIDGIVQRIPYPLAVYEIDRYRDAVHWFEQGIALVETFAVGELIAADGAPINE